MAGLKCLVFEVVVQNASGMSRGMGHWPWPDAAPDQQRRLKDAMMAVIASRGYSMLPLWGSVQFQILATIETITDGNLMTMIAEREANIAFTSGQWMTWTILNHQAAGKEGSANGKAT